ncbi:MAG: hypothetical protein EBS20_09165 [Actinobacteria bacterium]|nr:hypothetical protein [Actinomycetota bacterium]
MAPVSLPGVAPARRCTACVAAWRCTTVRGAPTGSITDAGGVVMFDVEMVDSEAGAVPASAATRSCNGRDRSATTASRESVDADRCSVVTPPPPAAAPASLDSDSVDVDSGRAVASRRCRRSAVLVANAGEVGVVGERRAVGVTSPRVDPLRRWLTARGNGREGCRC